MVRRPKGRYDTTDLYTLPTFFPIPGFYRHVIAPGQDNACGGMDGETSNVVRVSLEGGHFLVGVVIEDAKLEII